MSVRRLRNEEATFRIASSIYLIESVLY